MTPVQVFENVISDRGSRYAVSGGPCANPEEARAMVAALCRKKKFARATHNTWAFLTDRGAFKNDDGEAGAGKTRLVEEAAGQLASRFGARVLEGRCVPYGEANVWWPIADVLRHAFGLAHDSSEEEARAAPLESVTVYLTLQGSMGFLQLELKADGSARSVGGLVTWPLAGEHTGRLREGEFEDVAEMFEALEIESIPAATRSRAKSG